MRFLSTVLLQAVVLSVALQAQSVQVKSEEAGIPLPDRTYDADHVPTYAGFFGGVAFTSSPTVPILSAEIALRYSYFGLGASFVNLLDSEFSVRDLRVERTPGIDIYLYIPTNDMPALHINGGAYFSDSTIFGFGVGFMIPIDGGRTGTTAGFGFHTLKGVQLNFGRLLSI